MSGGIPCRIGAVKQTSEEDASLDSALEVVAKDFDSRQNEVGRLEAMSNLAFCSLSLGDAQTALDYAHQILTVLSHTVADTP